MKASGQETVRSFQQADADNANKQTPLELIQQGDQIIVRTNQDKVSDRVQPNAELEISVPDGSSIEAHGRYGDFDIQSVNGNVNINSDNAGVRLENLGGNVQIETRASDTIRAVDVKGNVELKGRGDDVELRNIAGLVTVNGVYVGEIQLSNLAQPLRWEDPQNSMGFEKLPGQIRASRGEFTGNNIVGPIRLKARSSDVQLSDFTQSLDLTLDRGDIDLKPGQESAEDGCSHAIGRHRRWRCCPARSSTCGLPLSMATRTTNMAIRCAKRKSGHGDTIAGSTGRWPAIAVGDGPGIGQCAQGERGRDDHVPGHPERAEPPKPPKPPSNAE